MNSTNLQLRTASGNQLSLEEAHDWCGRECESLGWCCNDYKLGSNQMLSCAQACMIRMRGHLSKTTCELTYCIGKKECALEINGFEYSTCDTCEDLDPTNAKCLDGTGSGHGDQACKAGCGLDYSTANCGYSAETCKAVLAALDISAGSDKREFSSINHRTKGCFAYHEGAEHGLSKTGYYGLTEAGQHVKSEAQLNSITEDLDGRDHRFRPAGTHGCQVYVPTQWDESKTTCDGSETTWGELGKVYEDVETLEECEKKCSGIPECEYIQFEQLENKCHLYQDCKAQKDCLYGCGRTLERPFRKETENAAYQTDLIVMADANSKNAEFSLEECAIRCKSMSGTSHFSYGRNGRDKNCFCIKGAYDKKAKISNNNWDTYKLESRDWHFFDKEDGEAVRCVQGDSKLECASKDGGYCLTGMYGAPDNYAYLPEVKSPKPFSQKCAGLKAVDGSDPCDELGCTWYGPVEETNDYYYDSDSSTTEVVDDDSVFFGGKYKIEAKSPGATGSNGALEVPKLSEGGKLGLTVTWKKDGYMECDTGNCDFYIDSIAGKEGKHKIEAIDPYGLKGVLRVTGLKKDATDGLGITWNEGGYDACPEPECDLIIRANGDGTYQIVAEDLGHGEGNLLVDGIEEGKDGGALKWFKKESAKKLKKVFSISAVEACWETKVEDKFCSVYKTAAELQAEAGLPNTDNTLEQCQTACKNDNECVGIYFGFLAMEQAYGHCALCKEGYKLQDSGQNVFSFYKQKPCQQEFEEKEDEGGAAEQGGLDAANAAGDQGQMDNMPPSAGGAGQAAAAAAAAEEEVAECSNTDGEARDQKGNTCLQGYSNVDGPTCKLGELDDSDFTALTMCCYCGGGHTPCTCCGTNWGCKDIPDGDGDCDMDSDCQTGLMCGVKNCVGGQYDADDDCCVALPPSEEDCTDTDLGVYDNKGKACTEYVDHDGDGTVQACLKGEYDDDDFSARIMCCNCKGGFTVGEETHRTDGCTHDQFQCKDGTCIDKSYKCDGSIANENAKWSEDCPDKSDEDITTCCDSGERFNVYPRGICLRIKNSLDKSCSECTDDKGNGMIGMSTGCQEVKLIFDCNGMWRDGMLLKEACPLTCDACPEEDSCGVCDGDGQSCKEVMPDCQMSSAAADAWTSSSSAEYKCIDFPKMSASERSVLCATESDADGNVAQDVCHQCGLCTEVCPSTCLGGTCDTWMIDNQGGSNSADQCQELETVNGCNCHGCAYCTCGNGECDETETYANCPSDCSTCKLTATQKDTCGYLLYYYNDNTDMTGSEACYTLMQQGVDCTACITEGFCDCSTDEDCEKISGYTCSTDNLCTPPCNSNEDCEGSKICNEGLCVEDVCRPSLTNGKCANEWQTCSPEGVCVGCNKDYSSESPFHNCDMAWTENQTPKTCAWLEYHIESADGTKWDCSGCECPGDQPCYTFTTERECVDLCTWDGTACSGCVDTDFNGVEDSDHFDCYSYYGFPTPAAAGCLQYDDTDFSSALMCCRCGGGAGGFDNEEAGKNEEEVVIAPIQSGDKYKIESRDMSFNYGALRVWNLEAGGVNGLAVRLFYKDSEDSYDACPSPGCDLYISERQGAFNGFKIEAHDSSGLNGTLSVWELADGAQPTMDVKWWNGDYESCPKPSCDFFLNPIGDPRDGKYKIEVQTLDGSVGALGVAGIRSGAQTGLSLKYFQGGYADCEEPTCDFYITNLNPNVTVTANMSNYTLPATVNGTASRTWPEGTAALVGDPHVTNMQGEKFDVMHAGMFELLHVPMGAREESTLLSVVANIARANPRWCESMFIESLSATGQWLGNQKEVVFQAGSLRDPRPLGFKINGPTSKLYTHSESLKDKIYFEFETGGSSPHIKIIPVSLENGRAAFRATVGPLTVQVSLVKHPHFQFMNVDVEGLHELSLVMDIGGILGADGHADALKIDAAGCKNKPMDKIKKTSTQDKNMRRLRNGKENSLDMMRQQTDEIAYDLDPASLEDTGLGSFMRAI